MENETLKYTGNTKSRSEESNSSDLRLFPYLPDDNLVEAVNIAIQLERPLLLKGEPGCGKTQLAYSVAHKLDLSLDAWYVKSTSRARDGLYTYDTVGRLRDAQLAATGQTSPQELQRIKKPMSYVRLGPIGRAFVKDRRSVVLIDEIDKADIDFPNDLLLELDERRFIIEETGIEIKAKNPPIMIVTSNDEKDLPNAFLRRCLFHYIEFPKRERLIEIVKVHFPTAQEKLVTEAVDRFNNLRQEMQKSEGGRGKLISTSELIDWFRILHFQHPSEAEALAKLNGEIPYLYALLKNREDQLRYRNKNQNNG
ncbi:MAG: MoxR family ATPase [Xenococcaceae cyanobacterium MO_188.B19]|nr:MoxR family ATPase [Xenococcaceae cyanobacterium MO_188.B19]